MTINFKQRIATVSVIAFAVLLGGCASTTTTESTGQYIDDSVITTKVKSNLIAAKDIKSGNITVNTFKGVVQLSGFVSSPQQVLEAGQVASKVSGVVKVENDLLVK